MKIIFSEKARRILQNKKRLEKELNIKISGKGKNISIIGTPENEFIAEKVIDAINFGFPLRKALLIKKEECIFEIIPIKDLTRRHDLKTIKGRIIGKKGKTLKVLEELSDCLILPKEDGYEVGIIGDPENIECAQEAIIHLIKGSKHSNVYRFLEKNKPKEIIDLGLKK